MDELKKNHREKRGWDMDGKWDGELIDHGLKMNGTWMECKWNMDVYYLDSTHNSETDNFPLNLNINIVI